MNLIPVIPVSGREPLLEYTVSRLFDKLKVKHVICAGNTISEKGICEEYGADFIFCRNTPLGKKWNDCILAAKKYNPDGILIVGSSDWLSDNWLEEVCKYLPEYDLIGKHDTGFLDVGKDNYKRLIYWGGYGEDTPRGKEPIGIGRVFGKRILDKMDWKIFDDHLDSSLDYCSFNNITANGGKTKLIYDSKIQSLSISTYRWINKHIFENEAWYKTAVKIDDVDGWLKKWNFTEGLNLFDEGVGYQNERSYDYFYTHGGFKYDKEKETDFMIKAMPDIISDKSKTLIDVGCGDGFWSDILSDWYQVYGVDISVGGIRTAQNKYPQCKFDCYDALTRIQRKKFDVVFCRSASFFQIKTTDELWEKHLQKMVSICNERFIYIQWIGDKLRSWNERKTAWFHDPLDVEAIFKKFGKPKCRQVATYLIAELYV